LNISVIIPVFNAAPFVRKSVKSALEQEETAEVLLIEDCSTDNSLEICKQLEKENKKVKLHRHSDGKNHGAGASRNLGIEKASCEFLAFLDADDYYLPGRFKKDTEILEGDETVDGVYNAIGFEIYDKEGEVRHIQNPFKELTTISELIPAEELFYRMSPTGSAGHFHIDGLTTRKKLFSKIGGFDTKLELSQDTHVLIKMTLLGRLEAGVLDRALAIRGVHSGNRIKDQEKLEQMRPLMYKSLLKWSRKKGIETDKRIILWEHYAQWTFHIKTQKCNRIKFFHKRKIYFMFFALMHPFVLKSKKTWRTIIR
jgi:glycosyltransferase involved in cell wall biosynthesis